MELFSAMNTLPFMTAVFLLSLRLAGLFVMTPVLFGTSVPPVMRGLLVLGLSVALVAGLANSAALHAPSKLFDANWGSIIAIAFSEVLLGAILSLGIQLAFAAIAMAGGLLDVQIGYGIAQVFDPVTRRQLPIITSAFNQFAILFFFIVNGHHALLRGITYSLDRFPLGQPWILTDMYGAIMKQLASLFSLGFALAAPVVFCIFLVEIALGVISRNLPQMNMFAMSAIVKVFIGLAAAALWAVGFGSLMARIYQSIFIGWNDIFATSHTLAVH